jgi:hypothetical protein
MLESFKILKKRNASYKLELSIEMNIHSVFHISLLRKDLENFLSKQIISSSSSVMIDDEKKFNVKNIINSRLTKRTINKKLQYKIKWVKHSSNRKWYSIENFENAKKIVANYHQRYLDKSSSHILAIKSLFISLMYVSERFDSIRFRFDFCHIDFKSTKNRIEVDSIRFDSISDRFEIEDKEYKKLLIWSFKCVANKYIYMHLAYAACTHAKKKISFVKFIELIRSISNSFEFCKSDKNWAQLLALKLRQMLKLFATRQILMFLMFLLTYLFFLACKLIRTSRTSKYWVANNFNICLNFKASNWAQFSSDLQNSNEFEMLRISSINFTKKKIFFACAHAA